MRACACIHMCERKIENRGKRGKEGEWKDREREEKRENAIDSVCECIYRYMCVCIIYVSYICEGFCKFRIIYILLYMRLCVCVCVCVCVCISVSIIG